MSIKNNCGNGFHDYEIIIDGKEFIKEVCKRCGKNLVTKKNRMGARESKEYMEEHIKDVLQPSNPLFEREYGKPKT